MRGLPQKQNARRADKIRLCGHLRRYKKIVKKTYIIYQKLSGEKEILQGIADRYNRLLRMLGKDMVERLVQDDIRIQEELEARKQKEQMPKKIGDRIQWARERSEEYNAQIKKNKTKYRGMEL